MKKYSDWWNLLEAEYLVLCYNWLKKKLFSQRTQPKEKNKLEFLMNNADLQTMNTIDKPAGPVPRFKKLEFSSNIVTNGIRTIQL